jgi:8-oxo-dGTP pyrophosphatase MutT (NUDIX family)
VDLGESLAEAAVRETREESGIECEITGLPAPPATGGCRITAVAHHESFLQVSATWMTTRP